MAGTTLAEAEAQRAAWLAALTALATSQSYDMGGRRLTRVDAPEAQKLYVFWDKEVKRLTRGGRIRITGATPT